MIREEKEQTGKYVLQMARLLEDGCYQQEMLLKAVRIIDEALEQEPKWIPVSERLPDKDKYSHGSVWERSVLVTAYFKWDDAKHTFIDMRLAENVINNNFIDECITAWMPLPEPYKESYYEATD